MHTAKNVELSDINTYTHDSVQDDNDNDSVQR